MAKIVFYEKPGCTGNARQQGLLIAAGHTLEVRDLLAHAWRADELRAFFGDLPVAEWFNRNAPRVKSGEVDPKAMSEAGALAAMLAEPLLIRRPLLEAGGERRAGFDPALIDRWLGLTPGGAAVTRGEAEACPKGPDAPPCPPRG